MTDTELQKLLLNYTQPAVERQKQVKKQVMGYISKHPLKRFHIRIQYVWAAATCFIFLTILTAAFSDNAIFAAVKENITAVIEQLFPPRMLEITPEGVEESIMHTPHSNLPSIPLQPGDAEKNPAAGIQMDNIPLFVIYVDESSYSASVENGQYIIRPVSIMETLPECKITISYLPDISLDEAAASRHSELEEAYTNVSEITQIDHPNGLYISSSSGNTWDSPVCETYFIDSGQGGIFVISSQYFMEATEGHGTRFAAMVSTFEVFGHLN